MLTPEPGATNSASEGKGRRYIWCQFKWNILKKDYLSETYLKIAFDMKIVFVFACFVMLNSCSEDDCKDNNSGAYCFKNRSGYEVTVYIGLGFVKVAPYGFVCRDTIAGTYGFAALQDSTSGNFQ